MQFKLILHSGIHLFVTYMCMAATEDALARTKIQDLEPNTLSSTKYVEQWGKSFTSSLTTLTFFLVCPRTDVEYILLEEVKIADPDKKSTSYQRGLIPSARKASTNRGTFATNW